jgi:hypothetical protein
MTVTVMVDGRCSELRRRVGPLGWVVLEELALLAVEDPDAGLIARVGVRGLAASLGVAKGTAASAVRRLIAAGLIVRADERRGEGGRFAGSGYRLWLTPGISVVGVPRGRVLSAGVLPGGVPLRVSPPATAAPSPSRPGAAIAVSLSTRAVGVDAARHEAEADDRAVANSAQGLLFDPVSSSEAGWAAGGRG